MGIHDLWLFILAGVLLNITPGPDMALIVARSMAQGTRAGIVAALGIGAGTFLHIAAAAIGLSALILASAVAFTLLKWAGALYLVYLGVQMMRSSARILPSSATAPAMPRASLKQIFFQGVLTNALNPKVALFFLALLPQFVDDAATSKTTAFVTLGLVFDAIGTLWNIAVAWFAGRLAASTGYAGMQIWLERAIGALFVAVGIKLAIAEAN